MRDADASSPELYYFAAVGTVLPEVDIVLAEGAFSIRLEGARVTEVGAEGIQGGRPLERFTIHFTRIFWSVDDGSGILQASYDMRDREGGGPAWGEESFVHLGPGVPGSPDMLLLSDLTHGITVPWELGRPIGRTQLEPLGLLSPGGASTLAHLSAIARGEVAPSLEARFTAIGQNGAPIDRIAYRLEPARMMSVQLETDPAGSLTEAFDVIGESIEWSAQRPDGSTVAQTWDTMDN